MCEMQKDQGLTDCAYATVIKDRLASFIQKHDDAG